MKNKFTILVLVLFISSPIHRAFSMVLQSDKQSLCKETDNEEQEPLKAFFSLPLPIMLRILQDISSEAKHSIITQSQKHLSQAPISNATLSLLPDELKLQILRDYLLAPPVGSRTEIKTIYDIDKAIKSRSLTQVNKGFRELASDPFIKGCLALKYVQDHPGRAVNDLVDAVSKGDLAIVQDLIKAGVNVNGINNHQNNLPQLDATDGAWALIKVKQVTTPLETAMMHEDESDNQSSDNNGALTIKIVEALLKAGANPNLQSYKSSWLLENTEMLSPLQIIIANNNISPLLRNQIVLMLLQAGAKPNLSTLNGQTSLSIAKALPKIAEPERLITLLKLYGAK